MRGNCRCAELLDWRREGAVSRGAAAARGCSIDGGRGLFLWELLLRGAARMMEGGRRLCVGELLLRGADQF